MGSDGLQAVNALGLAANFIMINNVFQFWQAAFQRRLLVLLVEKFRITQPRPQHALVAVDDVAGVGGLQIGHQQKAVHQLAVFIQQREIFLVLLHGQNQAFLRHGKEMRFKFRLQNNGVFHQRGYFVQQRIIGGNAGVQAA